MKTVAVIQARLGSTRLPGKVLQNLMGKTILQHVIERVRQAEGIDEIVIATTNAEQDEKIVQEAVKCGVKFFRGSESDVLGRYYLAALANNADIVVRITSDCPLIDPLVTGDMIAYFKQENLYDIVTNAGSEASQRTYPRGLDTEVFSFAALQEAYVNAERPYQREHVTPYIYENSENIYYYKNPVDYSGHRWTLDTVEDFLLIHALYERLYHGKHNFYMPQILECFNKEPELMAINAHIEQKKLR